MNIDDDLMSLRGGSADSNPDDDPFGGFSDPGDLGPASPGTPAGDAGGVPDWLEELGGFEDTDLSPSPTTQQPGATGFEPRARAARRSRSRSSGRRALGMTPQQRMILSIFLFLDVAVIGFMLLLAIGAISF